MLHSRSWIEKRYQIFVVTLLSALIGLSIVQIVILTSHDHSDSLDTYQPLSNGKPSVITAYPGFDLEYVEFDENKSEIVDYVRSDSYKQKLNAGRVIRENLGEIIYLNIWFRPGYIQVLDSYGIPDLRIKGPFLGFKIATPDSQSTITDEDAYSTRVSEIISMDEDGDMWASIIMEDMMITLEHPDLLRNGYTGLRLCEGFSGAILSGFYIFTYGGLHNKVSSYLGRLAQVDLDRANITAKKFNNLDCI